jgi:hypothetical protein
MMNRLMIYGMMMAGAMLLMTSCSSEDATQEVAPQEAIAISFGCNYDDEEENTTRAGYEGAMNTEDLYTTGFGAMASVTAGTPPTYDNKPNLMYNQEVEYTHVGDMENPLTGYWSYQPVKYWPTDLTHCYISAYAPYQELPIDGSGTGIYGLSDNSEAPYVDYRRCDNPQNVVDLLWYYEEPENIPAAGKLAMKMRHALARLELKVALAAAPDPVTTKVLIEKITLTGKMAKTGRLSLCSQETTGSGVDKKYYPVWSNQVFDKDGGGVDKDHIIQIKNEDNDPESYGIIDSQVRYMPGLPYAWQPEGLKVYDAEVEGKNYLNALSTGDRIGYIYLIPQTTLSLKLNVKYHKITSAGVDTEGEKSIDASPDPTPISISPLYGNKTYTLTIRLSDI